MCSVTDNIKDAVVSTLSENGKWMTANEIISYANSKGWLESKTAPRQAMSHPVYRVLTAMMRKDESKVHGLERRVRESGDEVGHFEYAYKGLYDGSKILVGGKAMSVMSGEKVKIGSKYYYKKWLEAHPDKWAELEEAAKNYKSMLDIALEMMVKGEITN